MKDISEKEHNILVQDTMEPIINMNEDSEENKVINLMLNISGGLPLGWLTDEEWYLLNKFEINSENIGNKLESMLK